jgi:lipopolysaccharide/colanic/teichoic acid biosynthesis glycosyltransferase
LKATPSQDREAGFLERKYVREWSVFEDLRILLRTVPVVLSRRGAL